jgi:hypothetical protein
MAYILAKHQPHKFVYLYQYLTQDLILPTLDIKWGRPELTGWR